MIMHNDQTTYQTIHFKHNNNITWTNNNPGKQFKQDGRCAVDGSPTGRLLGFPDGVQTTLNVEPSLMSDRVVLDRRSTRDKRRHDRNTREPVWHVCEPVWRLEHPLVQS